MRNFSSAKNQVDSPKQMRVNPITLSFTKECAHLEKTFTRVYQEKSVALLRYAIIIALVTWSSIGFLDRYIDYNSYLKLWAIRYGIGVPIFIAGILLSYTDFLKKNMQAIVSLCVFLAGIAVIAMIYLAHSPLRDTYYVGLILVFIFAYTLLRLKFLWASLVCWLIVAAYETTAFVIGTPSKILLINSFFFINANIIGMFACYFFELSHRKNFFLTMQLEAEKEKVKAANEELESNVKERTRQLLKINEDLNIMINDFRAARDRLKKSEEKYRSIITSMEEGYYEMDLQCNFTFCNDSTLKIFGHDSHKELIGKNLRSYMSKENAEHVLKAFNNVYQNNIPEKAMNWEIKTARGEICFLEVSASRINDAIGQPQGFRGIIRDITERRRMERKLLEYYENIKQTQTMTILGLAKLAEYRDKNTGEHLERMMEYTRILTTALAQHPKYRSYITDDYIEDICLSSILHDIGKVGITDDILLKPGPLTPDEYEKVKKHPLFGGDALQAIEEKVKGKSFLSLGKEICYYHHERWDGTGYPKGLKGEEIPLSARIVALVDVYDAITSDRVYKKALSHDETVRIIANERGKHFDPNIVDVFLANEKKFKQILESYRKNRKTGSGSDPGKDMAAV
ncbi:MAG: hypothetical protein DRH32_08030 [Deltaproteobacteria bacterium]|nr:MAG: hypothetical protein DRH32_08030 [Deltaproteobacteria bacterium]